MTRATVLLAAEAVFVEFGFHRATIELIAERAGFTKGAVYSSFANKDEIFLELFRVRVKQRAAIVATAVARETDVAAKPRALGEALTLLAKKDPHWTPLLMEFWIHALREPGLRQALADVRNQLRNAVSEGFAKSPRSRGKADLSADALATIVFALSNGLAMEWATDPRATDPEILPTVLERLLSGT
ncbi:TetR/AcrR family transcriptional regulator [Afipia sp. GAS231]|uniref:TetR/AcrR family transcriptional regulator n=1 Tax=Afipia sp. GAS231 TaxID=1882747 RepID=UPI000B0745C0|nr:TetR/AcrR family transcriptional regulator [Afipia sp. GAS231]